MAKPLGLQTRGVCVCIFKLALVEGHCQCMLSGCVVSAGKALFKWVLGGWRVPVCVSVCTVNAWDTICPNICWLQQAHLRTKFITG